MENQLKIHLVIEVDYESGELNAHPDSNFLSFQYPVFHTGLVFLATMSQLPSSQMQRNQACQCNIPMDFHRPLQERSNAQGKFQDMGQPRYHLVNLVAPVRTQISYKRVCSDLEAKRIFMVTPELLNYL